MPSSSRMRYVFPSLAMPRARHIGVRELVDDGDLGMTLDDRVDVHLLERHAAVGDALARDDLDVARLRLRFFPAVRLDETDDGVDAAATEVVRLL